MNDAVKLSSIAFFAVVAAFSPVTAQDVAKSRQLFQTCAACHTDAPGGLGPGLKGVMGRKAGSVPGYLYSMAIKRSNLTWNAANLRRFLINPQATVPGNRMPYGGAAPTDADVLVKYLATLK